MAEQDAPNLISLTKEEAEAFKQRIADSSLSEKDRQIVIALLSFSFWLQVQLERAKLTILRLKKIFGLPTEKKKPKAADAQETATPENNQLASSDADTTPSTDKNVSASAELSPQKRKPIFDPNANHGRLAASDYTGCPRIAIHHDHLKAGSCCPNCAEVSASGRLSALLPREVVKLQGSPLITGICYEVDRLRCNLCGDQFEAEMPTEIANRPKYDETCRTSLALSRYYSGMPFKRLETLQALQGVPVPDATQWDKINELYPLVYPVYLALEMMAAQGQLIYYDDTGNRILAAYGEKKAVHTTAFISALGDHKIYLFYTSQRYAGENMELLMGDRTTEEPLITMTDASSQNMPKKMNVDLLAHWILCFCLVHGRRKFYEMLNFFPQECEHVLDIIGQVYQHDAYCKKEKLNSEQRLKYHREKSASLMGALRVWLNNQLLHHLAEDNGGFGQAIRYMLRHWSALTRFLSVAGAPIDNSLCEQAIKVAIRHRRNSLFYKTFKGAQVGDCLMSVIHTAAKNNVNIFEYLNALQCHQHAVKENPNVWLPWNYQSTLEHMTERALLQAA